MTGGFDKYFLTIHGPVDSGQGKEGVKKAHKRSKENPGVPLSLVSVKDPGQG